MFRVCDFPRTNQLYANLLVDSFSKQQILPEEVYSIAGFVTKQYREGTRARISYYRGVNSSAEASVFSDSDIRIRLFDLLVDRLGGDDQVIVDKLKVSKSRFDKVNSAIRTFLNAH